MCPGGKDGPRRGNAISLDEVLSTVTRVWETPQESARVHKVMEERGRKVSHGNFEGPSPVLLRRRLSAPETIMRKHVLAQQRSDSQDSDGTQASDVRSCQWRNDSSGAGSDSNLSRKRDCGLMRKSTLLRRLWSNTKPLSDKNSRPQFEWSSFGRLSTGRSTHSLSSAQSSPEHKLQGRRQFNSAEFKISPKHSNRPLIRNSDQSSSPIRKTPMASSNRETISVSCNSNYSYVTSIETNNSNRTSKNYSENDFETYTPSDSAYTNSRSNFSSESNSRTTMSSDIHKAIVGFSDASNENANKLDANANNMNDELHSIKNTETQTVETTNVNVISNVQLSKSTLDVIYSHVMKDVQKSLPSVINVSASLPENPEAKVVNVQQVPSFYLKRKEENLTNHNQSQNQILKYMISNVNAGSQYSKPAEIPQVVVPRYSALPITSSMEVNASSADSTDRESDTISLVDSLEDPSSPRVESSNLSRYDDKPVRGDISALLPDNSEYLKSKANKKTAFFVPIETNAKPLSKPVSEHLPDKLKERLSKRQARREQKMQEAKAKQFSPTSDSNYVSSGDNQIHFVVDHTTEYLGNDTQNTNERDVNSNRRRSKPLLPKIQTIRKIKINPRENKSTKRKACYRDEQGENSSGTSRSYWTPKSKHRVPEKLSPLYTSKNEYFCNQTPGKVYHKTELNNSTKRIEILEIMECIEVTPEKYVHHTPKSKSRIPVLVHQRLHKMPKVNARIGEKPAFLDFREIQIDDPKIDQLIANILIDTLQHTELDEERNKSNVMEKPCVAKHCNNRYQQRFEVIPEELQQSSIDAVTNNNEELEQKGEADNDSRKNNNENGKNNEGNAMYHQDSCKGRAAVSMEKTDNSSTIPQGWITFYTLQKSDGSPESTSDEGKNDTKEQIQTKNEEALNAEAVEKTEDDAKEKDKPKDEYTNVEVQKGESPDTEKMSSPSDFEFKYDNSRHKRQIPQKKGRPRNASTRANIQKQNLHGWSVTVSGTNASGDFAPNLEMRLKFPKPHLQNVANSDSGLGEDRSRRLSNFFDTHQKQFDQKSYDVSSNENDISCTDERRCKLPSINNRDQRINKRYKRCDTTTTSKTEPRQTKTSSRRFSLSRPRQLPLLTSSNVNIDNDIDFNSEERHLNELLRRFPHLLAVTGNAICPERKSRTYNMSERELVRTVYTHPH